MLKNIDTASDLSKHNNTESDLLCLKDNDTMLDILVGYEPADLTVHPPPPQNDRGWVIFFCIIGV